MVPKMLHLRFFVLLLLLGSSVSYDGPVETYDFIVVGGGSAGSVLTNRLTENGKFKVLLLEKGGEPNSITEVPGLVPLMYFTENVDKLFMEKQEGLGMGLTDERIAWTRGTGLGGTSLLNYMIYTRGHREDYDRIAKLGNPGWSYDEVLPFYKKFERASIKYLNSTVRGTEGELDSVEIPTKSKVVQAFVEACMQTGMPFLKDYNNGNPMGIGYLQTNERHGRRCHAEKAFLHDIRHTRENLVIKTHSHATRLVINRDTKEVEGVEYTTGTAKYFARAEKEVILTAGSFFSPHLLLLSGIGPRDVLEEFGLEVIHELPVGQTIYDHLVFPGLVFELNETIVPTSLEELLQASNILDFANNGDGPLASPGGVEAIGFIQTPVSEEKLEYTDVELVFISGGFNNGFGSYMKEEFRLSDETYNTIWKPLEGKPVWTLFPMPFHPKSRGYLKLQSSDPTVPPKFYGNYFTDPGRSDMRTMIAAIRKVQEIAKAPALAKYGSKQVLTPLPNCKKFEVDSDDFWECQIRSITSSVWHQVGTCKIGPKDDPEAVVDHELKVYGIRKLRVGDVSILPKSTAAHTNIPTTMVGERAADFILKSHPN